ncbi:MAG: SUMF1/EgtB/PvdO family nonheme iron enzyme [Anaerolineae bacterium]|nr:SUMF1/EgtB/PvdO family nonheme iron enzyme [Anaerolineae bacterium]
MTKLFISYRRADSRKDAGRIYDRLVEAFGKENIFKDVDNIPLGRDFRGVLREAVAQCDVLLAIIGQQWLSIKDEHGNRRLDNPSDFVRIEIESALQRENCLVIPALVDNAAVPHANDLPPDLRALAFRNAIQVRDDPDFHNDVSRLIGELKQHYGENPQPAAKPQPQKRSYDVLAAINDFYRAFDDSQWERAREILAEIRVSEKAPRVFNVDMQEKEIWNAIEAEAREREYEVLRLMAGRANKQQVREALQVFWQDFPDYDPDNIADKVRLDSPHPQHSTPIAAPRLAQHHEVKTVLPAPFEWIDIPAGRVTLVPRASDEEYSYLKTDTTVDVPAFVIAKYPITNAQYAKFVDAGGYQQQKWWTEVGWRQREKEGWTEPLYWGDEKWNSAEQPVVGVCWYEALAFCLWLTEMSGEQITLPTEAGWQWAAQGADEYVYPWGNRWDASCCNTWESGIGNATPVQQYEGRGDSPFGVVDMAGNVWEWGLTNYNTGVNEMNIRAGRLVVRGGSWHSDLEYAQTICRVRSLSTDRFRSRGFRIAKMA